MKIVAYILIVLSSIFLILSIFNPAFDFGVSPIIDPGLASSFGSFIGGVLGPLLSIVSILLLLDTIKNQKREIDIGETKTHVYELLKYNRDNVGSFEYAKSSDSVAHSYFGISFFVYAKRQIEEAYERLIDFLPKHDKDILVVIAYQVFILELVTKVNQYY